MTHGPPPWEPSWPTRTGPVDADRDRGAPRGAAPPTPPGRRVRTTAVRPVERSGPLEIRQSERVEVSAGKRPAERCGTSGAPRAAIAASREDSVRENDAHSQLAGRGPGRRPRSELGRLLTKHTSPRSTRRTLGCGARGDQRIVGGAGRRGRDSGRRRGLTAVKASHAGADLGYPCLLYFGFERAMTRFSAALASRMLGFCSIWTLAPGICAS